MELYPSDPLEGLDFYKSGSIGETSDGYDHFNSVFSEPTWMEASKDFNSLRPSIPSSEIYVPRKVKSSSRSVTAPCEESSLASSGGHSITKKRIVKTPGPKCSDPNELLQLCRRGWTLSKGSKNKPVLGRINPLTVENDIQDFADRYADAKSISSGTRTPNLNSIGERFQPQMWPNEKTVNFKRPNKKLTKNAQDFRSRDLQLSTLGSSPSYTLGKDIRFHEEKYRSPGPIFEPDRSFKIISKKSCTPIIGAAGRTLAGSIYYDEFNLKSHGNYYHANEAYFNHTTAPSARISESTIFPPKKKESIYDQMQSQKILDAHNPMSPIRHLREKLRKKESKKNVIL